MAPPPPATPTPSRFLLSKRQGNPSNASSATQAPPSESQRFHATPRFSSAARHQPTQSQHVPVFSTPSATPRPSATVPARRPPGTATRASQAFSSEIIESSQEQDERGDEVIDDGSEGEDAIEVYSSSPPRSPLQDSWQSDEPASKRRRISESPFEQSPDPSLVEGSPTMLGLENEIEDEVEAQDDMSRSQSFPFEEGEYEPVVDSYGDCDIGDKYDSPSFEVGHSPGFIDAVSGDDDEVYRRHSPSSSFAGGDDYPQMDEPPGGAVGLPTFRQPPRFRGQDPLAADQAGEGVATQDVRLPDALFTPQRRGAKYVSGGLAAELRDWLVQIKGDDGGHGRGATSDRFTTKLVVSEVESAPGMRIVQGRSVSLAEGQELSKSPANFVLAGEGRLDGLAKPRDVVRDMTVGIAQPSWEVVLEGGTAWVVACDWEVL